MPKASPLQNNFNAGELSPLIQGRVDVEKYSAGLATCLNAIPLLQGPVTRRSGTKFIAEVKTSSLSTRLVRFEFSTTQAYIIEFGNLYCRFYRDNGQVTETATTIEGITKANPAVVTDTAHGFSNGDRIVIIDVEGMTEVNNREFIVANKNVNDYELNDVLGANIDSSAYTTYSGSPSGAAAVIHELTTTYLTADLFQLKFVQSADVLYVTHPNYAPRKISRTGHTAWTITVMDFLDGPYLDANVSATTLTPAATTGSGINVTASAALWVSTDVGRLIRIQHSSTWGYAKITGFTSDTVVVVTIVNDFGATTAATNWRLGVWSDTTSYPSAVTFYENRLMFGGALNVPQRVDGSKSGDYENFEPTAADGTLANDNAVSFTLNAKSINVIKWMTDDEKGLLIGTVGAIWLMRPSSLNEALSPTNISAKISSKKGSKDVEPVQLGDKTFYVQTKGRKLRAITYKWEKDGLTSNDVSVFAEHITEGGMIELAKVDDPTPIIWAVRADGYLLGLTQEDEHDVEGWHKHLIAGAFGAGAAIVESVASIPSSDETRDETWIIVKRTIDSVTRRYIEHFDKEFLIGDDQDDAFFFDSGLNYDGTTTTSLTGLWHLNGESLGVLGDGAVQPNVTVTNGKVTGLATSASKFSIGLSYNSDIETERWEAGAADGTALGKTRRINRMGVLLLNTGTFRYGPDSANLDEHPFRDSDDLTADAIPLFTGILSIDWSDNYSFEGKIFCRAANGLPMTIAALAPQGKTEDRG